MIQTFNHFTRNDLFNILNSKSSSIFLPQFSVKDVNLSIVTPPELQGEYPGGRGLS